ncbi:MAG: amidohydrolase [Clostridia bacterium]|nr:amidohydrolase [Clostridia bacterium]MBO4883980.1 amidohydrolase [Clostridia bacterium]
MMNEKELLRQAESMKPWLVECYQALHRRPEPPLHETATHRWLRNRLDELGVEYLAPAENITIGLLDSGRPGACVGLRCDTDALLVQEETGLPFASENPGVMHACGHDAHMTAGLGAARLLSAHRDEWRGRVKLIFQPAEEAEGGADLVIATGLVDDVDVFFGLHVWSPYETGTLHVAPVAVSASVDMFSLRVSGRGGHGATPEKCADAVVAGAAVVSALQTVVSRGLSPMQPAVLTIGSFHAGTAGNIIAQEAELRGTLRALDEDTRRRGVALLERTAAAAAQAFGCAATLVNRRVSDVVINDGRAAQIALECARELVPAERIGGQRPMMLGDDFANYSAIAPGCYVQVGIASEEKGTCAAHHNGCFRVDEDVLPVCAAWMAAFAMRSGECWKR